MSNRWPGGIIRKTPVTPAGPFQNGAASGVWTLADAAYWTKQGLWPLAGNAQLVVEDVFSTWLYTGNGSTQTITNGIDLAGKGGLVWIKRRDGANDHILQNTSRGANNYLVSNSTVAEANAPTINFSFASNGFSQNNALNALNQSGFTYASWTFREAPKFFDVVTYTGDGTNNRSIAHNLGIAPGMIIVKNVTSAQSWLVYHRSTGTGNYLFLNGTDAVSTDANGFPSVSSTAFVPTANQSAFALNTSGQTFVAYLFAHDATSDGIIQCGSYSGSGVSGNTVTLGWEPQWVMLKASTTAQGWWMYDNMRGMPVGSNDAALSANTSGAEQSYEAIQPTATGFQLMNGNPDTNASGQTYIYIAIRRGPMKTPTLGTSVFAVNNNVVSDATKTTSGIITDLFLERPVKSGANPFSWVPRLTRGYMDSNSTAAENVPGAGYFAFDYMDGFLSNLAGNINPGLFYSFKRAPSFFDEVCYTGTGSVAAINHNLGVVPELIIVKRRSGISNWITYDAANGATKVMYLNLTNASASNSIFWNNTAPTSSQFTVGNSTEGNGSGSTYVAYLFASCPGVSKVGSYTGTGALQTINCAFTTGARFVLIKRTDSTGDWFVWDSARGISSGNDPYLLLNSTAAETTGTNYVDTDTTGFKVTAAAPAGINAVGGTYIFLAIA